MIKFLDKTKYSTCCSFSTNLFKLNIQPAVLPAHFYWNCFMCSKCNKLCHVQFVGNCLCAVYKKLIFNHFIYLNVKCNVLLILKCLINFYRKDGWAGWRSMKIIVVKFSRAVIWRLVSIPVPGRLSGMATKHI